MSRAKQEQVVLLKALEGLGASKDLMDLVKVVKEEEVGEETPLVIFLKRCSALPLAAVGVAVVRSPVAVLICSTT